MKRCTKCGVLKPYEEFPHHPQTKDGRDSWCKTCGREKRKAYQKKRYAENPEKRKAENTAWAATHREQINARVKRNKTAAKFYQAHKEKYKLQGFLRRQLQGRATPLRDDVVYERDGGICQLCGLPVDRVLRHPHPESLSLDHILPVSKGGSHTYDNIQLAHLRCNLSKGAR